MSMGGALGGPLTAFQYDWNMLPIGQQLWLKDLLTYKEFPPLQAPESYNLAAGPGAGQEGQCQRRERLAADTSVMRRQRAPHDRRAARRTTSASHVSPPIGIVQGS